MNLNPLLTRFVYNKKYNHPLFNQLSNYVNTLPRNITLGKRTSYMTTISSRLMKDPSVNRLLYQDVMERINELLIERINILDITNRALSSKKFIYNDEWWNGEVVFKSRANHSMEGIIDDYGKFYLIDHDEMTCISYATWGMFEAKLTVLGGYKYTLGEFTTSARSANVINDATKEFGWDTNKEYFNSHLQTHELSIINKPIIHQQEQKHPIITLKFLHSLIPNTDTREYLLRFLKTKLTTFRYSPVILSIVGVEGAGKDLLIQLLNRIVYDDIQSPPPILLKRVRNQWLENAYFIHLDEYGDRLLHHPNTAHTIKGIIKSITGSPTIQIVYAGRTLPSVVPNVTTFIITSNVKMFDVPVDDRRFFEITCPYSLHKLEWVKKLGGVIPVIKLLEAESLDFAYYLGNSIKAFPEDDENYVIAPATSNKELTLEQDIAYLIGNNLIGNLKEMYIEHEIPDYMEGWDKNRLYFDTVYALYKKIMGDKITKYIRQDWTLLKLINDALNQRPKKTYNSVNYVKTERKYWGVPNLTEFIEDNESKTNAEANEK